MNVVVSTGSGRLAGLEESRGVLSFRGIPYARPPRGALRFEAPEPMPGWPGVRQANEFGASAPQDPPPVRLARTLLGGGSQSEDCLYLNVWTPGVDRERRPVLVWIHGGAFMMGSSSTPIYGGSRMARRGDVVVVSINYRLGALGFLDLHSLAARPQPANLGIRDQIAALEWVRDNIEAFGGDPERVTVFGESAGAMSVGTLLGTPAARGLFQRAILQSGAADHANSVQTAAAVSSRFLQELGVSPDDVDGLKKAGVGRILRAQQSAFGAADPWSSGLPWAPTLGGWLLAHPPLDEIARGSAAHVPILIGTNREEWKLFRMGDPRRLNRADLELRIQHSLPRPEDTQAAFEAYAPDRSVRRRATAEDAWVAFQTDRMFHHPAERLAERHAATGGRCFAYLFTWRPPLMRRRVGSCHALEIPFVFGSVRAPALRPWIGGLAPGTIRLSEVIQDAWIAFARNGEPTHEKLPDWPTYSAGRRSVLELGRKVGPLDDPHAESRAFWAGRYQSPSRARL